MNALSNYYWIVNYNDWYHRTPYFTSYWRDSCFEVVLPFCCCDWGGCCCNWWMLNWVGDCCCCNWNIWGLTESCGTMHLDGFSPLISAVASFNRWTSAVKASFKAKPLHHKQNKLHQSWMQHKSINFFGLNVNCMLTN